MKIKAPHIKPLILSGLILVFLFACTEKDNDDVFDADQTAFLDNTSRIISDDYASFNQAVNDLKSKVDALINDANQSTVDAAQAALKASYIKWQSISMYEFGPAETAALKGAVNIFKTDINQIEMNISSGNFNLDQMAMKDAKGFPALDYLLNGQSDADIYNDLKTKSNRRTYLQAVAADIQAKVNKVTTDWESYANQYKSKKGVDVGSSIGLLINTLNQHYETFFRDNKIGVPLGVRSSGIARPDFVEAPYGKYSLELAIANFKAMKKLYNGGNAYGLDDYLSDLDGGDLNVAIQNQMNSIEMSLMSLTDPLADQITADPSKVQNTYNELQKLIVLWKVDLPSKMGVLITYQDNDGD